MRGRGLVDVRFLQIWISEDDAHQVEGTGLVVAAMHSGRNLVVGLRAHIGERDSGRVVPKSREWRDLHGKIVDCPSFVPTVSLPQDPLAGLCYHSPYTRQYDPPRHPSR